MRTNRQKQNRVVDGILYVGFLALMIMDLTGVDVHQFLGVGIVLLAIYHLILHRNWVITVTRQVAAFARSGKSTNLLFVDLALMTGFLTIGTTGLVISSWLNHPLDNYLAWWNVHVIASILTLVLIVLKLGLHWRWVANTITRSLRPAPALEQSPARAASLHQRVGRRQFLGIMGAVGVTTLFAAASAMTALVGTPGGSSVVAEAAPNATSTATKQALSASSAPAMVEEATNETPEAVPSPEVTATTGPTSTAGDEATPTPTKSLDSTPASQPTQTAEVSSQNTIDALSCQQQCRKGKHCSYPGSCHDYVDTNGNQLCDLGECVG
jgi:hypothetical protein